MRGCLLSSFYFPKKRNSLNFRSFCVLNIDSFPKKDFANIVLSYSVLDYSLSVPYLDTRKGTH